MNYAKPELIENNGFFTYAVLFNGNSKLTIVLFVG